MSFEGMDPSLLQDFLTESAELIEQLDRDLVTLEGVDTEDQASELLNGIFRALHTIKGAASFLSLTEVTTFAHAAEDALNKLRKGEAQVTQEVMDALLESSDVIRQQIDDLNAGQEATPGPDNLVAILHGIAASAEAAAPADASASNDAASPAMDPAALGCQALRSLDLPAQKVDLIEFMVADLRDAAVEIAKAIEQAKEDDTRNHASEELHRITDTLEKTTDFFELGALTELVQLTQAASDILPKMSGVMLEDLLVRLAAIKELLDRQSTVIDQQLEMVWPLDTFKTRLKTIIEGNPLPEEVAGKHGGDVAQLLVLDGVTPDGATPVAAPEIAAPEACVATDQASAAAPTPAAPQPAAPATPEAAPAKKDATNNQASDSARGGDVKRVVAEQTIRVEVGRLESLLNLVGQLVLNKNRFLALTRRVSELSIPQDLREDMATAAGDYDRVTGELQMGVMRTRMQPLAKLFDRYPRVIRDIARMTNKQIDLELVGKETEVDKSVLELLSDPLVHILRNSADHGVEGPEERQQGGKSATGVIKLEAEHQGSHVRLVIADDGKGIDREVIGNLAVERGLITRDKLAAMPDEEVFRFIFAAGFSTAKQVSDLSGRGVGMDVVRTNVNKMNGTINISSIKGKGTTIEILIPLTVAIMPAMMVGVGSHLYAVPLQSISEIVRPDQEAMHSIHGQPVMRLRDAVLPLITLQARLDETRMDDGGKFAVVVGVGNQRAGLIVDRLIGQQEIVIKPLDDVYTQGGPFSGATIREDGDVSLILDVIQLLRQSQSNKKVETKLAA